MVLKSQVIWGVSVDYRLSSTIESESIMQLEPKIP
jgi:hypothetical protein